MIRVTIDTNILVSATIAKGNEFKLLKLAKENKLILVLSLDIIKEFRGVISRDKFSYPKELIEEELSKLLEISEIVVPQKRVSIIKEDPSDNKILECASEGKADYIISGDEHLLKLEKFRGIQIVKAREFLNIFKKDN